MLIYVDVNFHHQPKVALSEAVLKYPQQKQK